MLRKLENYFTGNWKLLFYILFFPVTWIPWLIDSPNIGISALKILFLLFPIILIITAFWCTIASLITVMFRPARVEFIATLLITWWDGGKAILMYWGGVFKFILLSFGWIWGTLRIVILGTYHTIKEILFLPFTIVKSASNSYLKPGIPWIAVTLILGWMLMEAAIFAFVLTGMATEIFAQLTDTVPPTLIVVVVLFLFLSIVVGGSFACMHGLVEAIRKKERGNIIKMVVVEIAVMLFEVLFLYREFVEALAPFLAQMSGGSFRLGGFGIIVIASAAWLGIRASTWFLFGKAGTPVMLSIISREAVTGGSTSQSGPNLITAPLQWIKTIVGNFQQEINWFSKKGNELIEAFVLPPVQIFAVMTNFAMILLTSKTLFNLPLRSLNDIKDTKALINEITKHGGA